MSEDTREKILEAAISLFAQKGYSQTSVNDIVGRAGVTKPVLYYYFGNKEGLFTEIFRFCFEGFEEMFREAFKDVTELKEFIFRFVRFDLEMISQYREIISVLFSEFYSLRSHLSLDNMMSLTDRHYELIAGSLKICLKGEHRDEEVSEVVKILDGMLNYYEVGILKFDCKLEDEDYARLGGIVYKMINAIVN